MQSHGKKLNGSPKKYTAFMFPIEVHFVYILYMYNEGNCKENMCVY